MEAITASLATVGVELDPDMTMVRDSQVVVAVATVPETPEHREWMRSAVHIALKDDLGLEGCTVLVPPAPPSVGETHDEEAPAYRTLRTFATSVYKEIAYAYPWRDRDYMLARIPVLVNEAMQRVHDGGGHPVFQGNVDAILPTCEYRELYEEVALLMQRSPLTRLEWFHAVYIFRDVTVRLHDAAAALFIL